MTDIELVAPASRALSIEAREEARHLIENQAAFTRAFHEARALGRQMLECFSIMDEARKELELQGIVIATEFPEPIQAALRRHRGDLAGEDPYDLPGFMQGTPADVA